MRDGKKYPPSKKERMRATGGSGARRDLVAGNDAVEENRIGRKPRRMYTLSCLQPIQSGQIGPQCRDRTLYYGPCELRSWIATPNDGFLGFQPLQIIRGIATFPHHANDSPRNWISTNKLHYNQYSRQQYSNVTPHAYYNIYNNVVLRNVLYRSPYPMRTRATE